MCYFWHGNVIWILLYLTIIILLSYFSSDLCLSLQTFSQEPVIPVTSARPDQVEKVLKATYHEVMTKLQPQGRELDLLIVILPDNNGSLYGTSGQIFGISS